MTAAGTSTLAPPKRGVAHPADPSAMIAELVRLAGQRRSDGPSADPPAGDVSEIDWKAPCRFVRAEREALQRFAASAAERLSAAVAEMLGTEVTLSVRAVTEHYADGLDAAAEDDCGVALARKGGRSCGVLALRGERAREWIARLLGAPAAGTRKLGSVERGLVLDALSAAAGALLQAIQEAGGVGLVCGEQVESPPPGVGERPSDEFCRIAFAIAGDGPPDLTLTVSSDVLDGVVGTSGQRQDGAPQMLAHIQRGLVSVTVCLGRTKTFIRDILALEPGDVLVLQTRTGEPVPIIVHDRLVAHGLPARHNGKYAVKIVSNQQTPVATQTPVPRPKAATPSVPRRPAGDVPERTAAHV